MKNLAIFNYSLCALLTASVSTWAMVAPEDQGRMKIELHHTKGKQTVEEAQSLQPKDLPGYSEANAIRANPGLAKSSTCFQEVAKSLKDPNARGYIWLYGVPTNIDWRETLKATPQMQRMVDNVLATIQALSLQKERIRATLVQEFILATQYKTSPLKIEGLTLKYHTKQSTLPAVDEKLITGAINKVEPKSHEGRERIRTVMRVIVTKDMSNNQLELIAERLNRLLNRQQLKLADTLPVLRLVLGNLNAQDRVEIVNEYLARNLVVLKKSLALKLNATQRSSLINFFREATLIKDYRTTALRIGFKDPETVILPFAEKFPSFITLGCSSGRVNTYRQIKHISDIYRAVDPKEWSALDKALSRALSLVNEEDKEDMLRAVSTTIPPKDLVKTLQECENPGDYAKLLRMSENPFGELGISPVIYHSAENYVIQQRWSSHSSSKTNKSGLKFKFK